MWALVVAMLAVPLAARAEGTDTERAAQAQAACLSGDYAKGVSILAELYVSTRNPTYIFNQGRCFEQSGKYEDAIVRFREYQRKNASAAIAADPAAEEHIAECQVLLDKQKAASSLTPPPSAQAPSAAPTAVGTEASPQPAQPTVAPLPTAGPISTGPDANREDPIQAAPLTSQTQPAEKFIHRRRKGAIWIGAGAGTGYGYHLASRYEWRRDADPVAAGMRMAGTVTFFPEIGYMIADYFGLAVQGRFEYISITGSGDTTQGRPAGNAFSVLARLLYYLDLGVDNAQLQFSADVGGGEGYRFSYPPTNRKPYEYWDPNTREACQTGGTCAPKPTLLTDTTRSGPIAFGAGIGFIYHFSRHIAANLELRALGAAPVFGFIGEAFGAFQVAFGGTAPASALGGARDNSGAGHWREESSVK